MWIILQIIIFQIEETYDLREGAISTCISYHQDKISNSKELQDRNTQKQSQMHVSYINLCFTDYKI